MSARAIKHSKLIYDEDRLQKAINSYNECMNKASDGSEVTGPQGLPVPMVLMEPQAQQSPQKKQKVKKTNISSKEKRRRQKQSTKDKQKSTKKRTDEEIIAALKLEFAMLTKEYNDLPDGMGQARIKKRENMARRFKIKEELKVAKQVI